MDIKVGEYVRTKYGEFALIKEVHPEIKAIRGKNKNATLLDFNLIKNNSFDIIDLIEVGDYVNGHLVVDLDKNIYNQKLVITEVDGKDGAIRHHYLEKSIKSIVTKEQFKAMEYEV